MTSLPQEIILETTNHCNLRCVMCHFHGRGVTKTRPLGEMDTALWESVIEQISRSTEHHTLITHGAGEPLLYPRLFELIQKAKACPNISVGFMTNAMLLEPDIAEKLLETGIDWLVFSIDGVDPETHARYRVNSDLKIIENNLTHLIKLKQKYNSSKPVLAFNMVCLPELKSQEEKYVRKWLPHADRIMLSRYRPVGSKHLERSMLPETRYPCPNIFRQMVIGWDGKVALCCEDIHCEVKIGDIKNQSLAEVWNGEPVMSIREAHKSARYAEVALCKECDTWAAEHIVESTQTEQNIEKTVTPANIVYRNAS